MPKSPTETYIAGVLSGTIPAGKLLRQTVERHVRDLKTAKKRALHFDQEAADRVIRFFGILRHSKGEWAGQPFVLEAWQQFALSVLFGWKRKDGTRRFRVAYLELPRKNGKTTVVAGIGLYLLVADDEPGAEIYSAATKREQARLSHSEAIRMVRASPALLKRIRPFRDNLHIVGTAAKFEPLGADDNTMDGLNIHGALIDELHAHRTRGVWDVLDTATGARRQPLIVAITTAGTDRLSVCWEQHEYARQVLEGVIEDDRFFAFIASIDEGDDWRDRKVWAKANPNLGISVKLEDLEARCARAEHQPAAQNAFRRLHLDEWTQQADRWLDLAAWDGCAQPVDLEEVEGAVCYGGLDLATTTDIAAFVLVVPPEDPEGLYSVIPYFFVPEENVLERVRRDRVPYDAWIRDGLIEATPGNVIDYRAIRAKIEELGERYQIAEIAFDRWGSQAISNDLIEAGFNMVQFGQGFASMSAPTKELLKLVLSKRLAHGGHPVLRWMADNLVVRQDPAGNVKPDKGKSTEKIDGIVALVMALDRSIRKEGAPTTSIYETRGLESL